MKWFKLFLGLFAFFLLVLVLVYKFSSKREGLLTNDYGIVTNEDIDFEKTIYCPEYFSSKKFSVCNYWQCLKPEKYHLSCETFYLEGEGYLGELTFWILSGGKKYYFSTKRNYSAQACLENVKDINRVISNQRIVCISASHLPDEDEKDSHWILERIKTKTDFWSMSHVWSPDEDN